MTENAAQFQPQTDDVFARIARDYDRYCDYFSFFIQRLWKRAFAAEVTACSGDWLDLASGTGDIPQRVLNASTRRGQVVVSDICLPMLDVARTKLEDRAVTFARIDAGDMRDVPNDSFDVISMAFGMKIVDRDAALREIYRCLKPGGVFLCIEASRIGWAPLQALYLTYMNLCLPVMGQLIARGDRSAYDYLLRGIHDFPDGKTFTRYLESKHFEAVSVRPLSLGIVAIHRAHKPL
ncbi:ubiquinone/menaquinone biosynthesis methyltransferase [Asticcacaulis sp. YBE204]|uniref:ubiquinone/menaquinone biosynthesis methyltransferase n=1 Tax=Asticcacaulis sp. YBE204 TaxID=1282363 RepID=UPI00138AFBAC|nr:ubiquinone/menaquinone biosynthesis methyltransferase [Asticcacaulis sp. YBE204]